MIQKPIVTVTLRDTQKGHLETRNRYQGSKAEVPDIAAPECSTQPFLSADRVKDCPGLSE